MTAALALIPIIVQLLPTITTGVAELLNFIGVVRTAAMQTAEWTPALEAQYRAAVLAAKDNPADKPDAA